jgi:hypothetical protein
MMRPSRIVAVRRPFIEYLLKHGDPSTRYKLAVDGIGRRRTKRNDIRTSARVAAVLAERDRNGRIPLHPYTKWTGAHWVLVTLADLGYPPGDHALWPLRDQVLEWLLDPRRWRPRRRSDEPYLGPILTIAGRDRIHASLEGNALYAILALGLADQRVDTLAQRLLETQWDDGGWNCDRRPSASHASFTETLIPLRGLIWHARERRSRRSATGARHAARGRNAPSASSLQARIERQINFIRVREAALSLLLALRRVVRAQGPGRRRLSRRRAMRRRDRPSSFEAAGRRWLRGRREILGGPNQQKPPLARDVGTHWRLTLE